MNEQVTFKVWEPDAYEQSNRRKDAQDSSSKPSLGVNTAVGRGRGRGSSRGRTTTVGRGTIPGTNTWEPQGRPTPGWAMQIGRPGHAERNETSQPSFSEMSYEVGFNSPNQASLENNSSLPTNPTVSDRCYSPDNYVQQPDSLGSSPGQTLDEVTQEAATPLQLKWQLTAERSHPGMQGPKDSSLPLSLSRFLRLDGDILTEGENVIVVTEIPLSATQDGLVDTIRNAVKTARGPPSEVKIIAWRIGEASVYISKFEGISVALY